MAEPFEVTKTVYSVLDFLEWQRQGTLNLRPYFQRNSVWTPKAKSQLIDTFLRGWPVPIIFLQMKTDPGTLRNIRHVVDGQQRLRTILAYLDIDSLPDADESDHFTVLRSHNREYGGMSFSALPQNIKERLIQTELSVHVLPTSMPDAELLQIFARLNSTGLRLNFQELRNAKYHGEFKQFAYDLSYEQLDRWREWETFTPHDIATMDDVEFTSELIYLALHGVSAKSKSTLDRMYEDFDDEFRFADAVLERLRLAFGIVDDLVRPDKSGRQLRRFRQQGWLYSLFALALAERFGAPLLEQPADPDMSNIEGIGPRTLHKLLTAAHDRLESLSDLPDDLQKALRGAATDRSSRIARVNFLMGRVKAAKDSDG
ncbi:DUF262 domain-containing protein [Pseudonocardia cypriaca]|nr:DUF262 domain-containing protein [Pseudonocardia cypriaca]